MSYDIKLRTVMHCGWKFEIQCCTFIVTHAICLKAAYFTKQHRTFYELF